MRVLIVWSLVVLAAGLAAGAAGAGQDGWVSLLNGRNFDGWLMGLDRSCVVEDAVITLRRQMAEP